MSSLRWSQERGTPLHYACLRGHVSAVEALVARGAYSDKQDKDGNFCHHWAAGNSKLDVLEFLFQNPLCADMGKTVIRKANKVGDTILHAAARGDIGASINLLVGLGAKAEAENKKGDTPLHIAAMNGKENCVRALLAHTKTMKMNAEGKLPDQVAVSSAISDMIKHHAANPPAPAPAEASAEPAATEAAAQAKEVSDLAQHLSEDNLFGEADAGAMAGAPLSPHANRSLTSAEKKEALAHMTGAARDKLQKKSGQQKFLEKYNLASNRDPRVNSLLKSEE